MYKNQNLVERSMVFGEVASSSSGFDSPPGINEAPLVKFMVHGEIFDAIRRTSLRILGSNDADK